MSEEQQDQQPVAIGITDSAAGTTAGEQPAAAQPLSGMAAAALAAEGAGAKAKKSAAGQTAPAAATQAPQQAEQGAPAPNLDEVHAGLLTSLQALLMRSGFGETVAVHVVRADPEGAGGLISFQAKDRGLARSAASAILNGGDGREYRYCGDGPGPTDDLQAAYLHVDPLS